MQSSSVQGCIDQGAIPNTVLIGWYRTEGSPVPFLLIDIERKGILKRPYNHRIVSITEYPLYDILYVYKVSFFHSRYFTIAYFPH